MIFYFYMTARINEAQTRRKGTIQFSNLLLATIEKQQKRGIEPSCQTSSYRQQDVRSLPDKLPSRQLLPQHKAASSRLISGCLRHGYSVNGDGRGNSLKCCVLNLFAYAYTTLDIATDCLLSTTCTNQALMWDRERRQRCGGRQTLLNISVFLKSVDNKKTPRCCTGGVWPGKKSWPL